MSGKESSYENVTAFVNSDFAYSIGGALTNAFAVGEVGNVNDFFLVGAIPYQGTDYPLLTGNVFNSDGELLFRLEQNNLIINPGNCSKILGNQIGYEIHDAHDVPILRVSTQFEHVASLGREIYVTRINGTLYDRTGKVCVRMKGGDSGKGTTEIVGDTKSAIGVYGTHVGTTSTSLDSKDIMKAVVAMHSHGEITRYLTGRIENEDIEFDGAFIDNVEMVNCNVKISSGKFHSEGYNKFSKCRFSLGAEMKNAFDVIMPIYNSLKSD